MRHQQNNDHLVDTGNNKNDKLITGETRGFAKLEKNDSDNCVVTFATRTDFKDRKPAKIVESQIYRSVEVVFELRDFFNRDDEIDQIERNNFVEKMVNAEAAEVYSELENVMITRVMEKMGSITDDTFQPLVSSDIRTKVSFSNHFLPSNFSKKKTKKIPHFIAEYCSCAR